MYTFYSHIKKQRGFTLVEMLVSIALFSIVMLVGLSALLTLIDQNRRTQAINSVIRDLNFSLESMVRTIRTGNEYGCNGAVGNNCVGGGSVFIVTDQDGRSIKFRFIESGGIGRLQRKIENEPYIDITSENVDIQDLVFYVSGASTGDGLQPRVLLTISGVSLRDEAPVAFDMQTTITQRMIDL